MRTGGNIAGNIKSECIKMRHTMLLWTHLLVPLAGIFLFLLYYRGSIWSAAGKAEAYLHVTAAAYPFLTGVVCALSAELEEAGHYQTFFLSAGRKYQALLTKWIVLMAFSLFSSFLAVCGFGAGFTLLIGNNPYTAAVYMKAALSLWMGQGVLYLIHLFLGLQYGKGISIGAGVVESLIGAVCLTGLGDGIWPYLPCAWSSRWCSYLLLYTKDKERWNRIEGGFTVECLICLVLWLIITVLIFTWFHFYEGRRCRD